MTAPNERPAQIGVEAQLTEPDLGRGVVWATFKLLPPFPDGDWLKVSITARVYSLAEVERRGVVPETPVAEGPEVLKRARTEPGAVALELPPRPYGEWAVVPKVHSVDDSYRSPFVPSLCYFGRVTYGQSVRISTENLLALYSGAANNPLVTDEIRRMVQQGVVLAEGPDGVLYRPREENGDLRLDRLKA